MKWRTQGRVFVEETRRPIAGLVVEVWDKDLVTRDDFLGQATSDADGCWAVEYDDAAFNDFGLDPNPDLFVRVRLPGPTGREILSSEGFIRNNADVNETFDLAISCWTFQSGDPAAFLRYRPCMHGVVRVAGTRERLRGLDVALTSSQGEVYARTALKDGAYALWMDAPPAEANLRLAVPKGPVLVDVPVIVSPDDPSPQDFEVDPAVLDELPLDVAAYIRPAVPLPTAIPPLRR